MACCVVNCTNRLKRRNKRRCFGLTGEFWHPPARPPPHTCSAFAAADLDPDFMFMRVFVTGGLVLTQEKSFAAWLLWEAPQKSTASLHRLHLGHRSVPGVSEWKWLLFVHYIFFDLEMEENTKLTFLFWIRLNRIAQVYVIDSSAIHPVHRVLFSVFYLTVYVCLWPRVLNSSAGFIASRCCQYLLHDSVLFFLPPAQRYEPCQHFNLSDCTNSWHHLRERERAERRSAPGELITCCITWVQSVNSLLAQSHGELELPNGQAAKWLGTACLTFRSCSLAARATSTPPHLRCFSNRSDKERTAAVADQVLSHYRRVLFINKREFKW